MTTFADILQHFPGARQKSADKWIATCPSCGKRGKLQLTEGKVKAFLKCWSGCDEQSILLAAGLADARFSSTAAPADPPRRRDTPAAPYPAPRTLARSHRQELRASGISDAVIATMGVWTETEPAALRSLGFSAAQSRLVPSLVFPCHTPDGRVLYQIKPNRPYLDEDGKTIKYMTAAGGGYGIGVLPHRAGDLADPAIPLLITEGAKKQGAAETHGLLCVSLSGVWMWQRKNEQGEHVPLPEWDDIVLQERLVYVAFDSDAMRKKDVHDALQGLVAFLASRGAVVKIVYLPDQDDGAKTGMDDYLAAGHSVADLLALADDALRPIPPDFTQEVVKSLQKRMRGKDAEFSATGITFSTLSARTVQSAGRALRGLEGEMRNATFWAWGDLWLATKEIAEPKTLAVTFAKWFGQENVNRASEAASIARKFPADKFNRLIPPWVFREIRDADPETQQLILGMPEGSMSRAQIRACVRESKGLEGYATPKEPRNPPSQDGILPLFRRLKEKVPQDLLADLVRYVEEWGTEEIEELIHRRQEQEHLKGKNRAGAGFDVDFWDLSETDLDCLPGGKYKGYGLADIEDHQYLGWLSEVAPAALRPLIEPHLWRTLEVEPPSESRDENRAGTGFDPSNPSNENRAGAGNDLPKPTDLEDENLSNPVPYMEEESPPILETEAAAGVSVPLRMVTVKPIDDDTTPPDDQGLTVVTIKPCERCQQRPARPGLAFCAPCGKWAEELMDRHRQRHKQQEVIR
jgi:hypothetical protein